MAQRALVRRSTAVAAFAIVSGLAAFAAPAAEAQTTPSETTIPAALSPTPRTDSTVFGWLGGFLHQQQGGNGYVWTKYSGGDVPVSGTRIGGVGGSGAGADTVATLLRAGANPVVQLQDMDANTTTVIDLPSGQNYIGTFGSRVLTYTPHTGAPATFDVISQPNGLTTDTPVTGLPAGTSLDTIRAADSLSAVVTYGAAGQLQMGVLDLSSGQLTPLNSGLVSAASLAVLNGSYVAWYDPEAVFPALHVQNRYGTPSPTTVQIPRPPLPSTYNVWVRQLAVSGDTLLVSYAVTHSGASTDDDVLGYPLYAMPLAGGSLTTVLPHMQQDTLQTTGTSALAVGGTSVTDWAARQLTFSSTGAVTATAVDSDPPVIAPIEGMSLAGGQLLTMEGAANPTPAYTRRIQLGTPPAYGSHTWFGTTGVPSNCATASGCVPPIGTGDGRISQLNSTGAADEVTVQGPTSLVTVDPGVSGGTLVDSDGRYVVYNNPSTGKQYVGDTTLSGSSKVLFTRPIAPGALSGGTLWTTGATAGTIEAVSLSTQQVTQTVNLGTSAVPTELQAAGGRWIYWSAGPSGPAGVHDLATNTNISVPAGPALLGDGYVVMHNTSGGNLVLDDVHTDTAVSSVFGATLASSAPLTDDRRVTWTVDKYSGGIAYLDTQDNVHIFDPQIPASSASGYRILPGQVLSPGHSLSSPSMTLVMQTDGNLVAYLKTGGTGLGPAIWSSGTWGNWDAYAVLQPDGNLVIYRAGKSDPADALWSTGTWGKPGASVVLQDDGNLVMYREGTTDPGNALWSSGSYARSQTISSGTVMQPGWWTQGQYTRLVMQPDGNLVMYRKRDGAAIWSSGTWGNPGAYAVMQSDGNLVVYRRGGGALWASGTWGNTGAYAVMQNDGNLVIYRKGTSDPGNALWASNTWSTAR